MIKRDLYCFKSGKLELSILDEVLEEETKETLACSSIGNQITCMPSDEEEAYAHSHEDEEVNSTSYPQPQLIITEEIAHTLKTMSGFLMQAEGIESENIHDGIKEDETLEHMQNFAQNSVGNIVEDKKVDAVQENKVIEKVDSKDTDQVLSEVKVHQNKSTEACLSTNTERVIKMQSMQHHINSNTALQQKVIDDILLSHFGEITAKFPYEKELKQKIENQIYKIRSYK